MCYSSGVEAQSGWLARLLLLRSPEACLRGYLRKLLAWLDMQRGARLARSLQRLEVLGCHRPLQAILWPACEPVEDPLLGGLRSLCWVEVVLFLGLRPLALQLLLVLEVL